MDIQKFLISCGNEILQGSISLSILLVVFTALERIFTFTPSKKPLRSTLLDLQYAFLGMLYPPFIYFILSAVFGYLAIQLESPLRAQHKSATLFAAQFIALIFARDCLIYIRHRIFHLNPIWAFHSVHHSSEDVNWISAVRFHPLENTIEWVSEILLFFGAAAIGFYPAVLSIAGMFIAVYNCFIHSNLRWTFGPLRYVFVSPVMHRWHHSDTPEAADKNFASVFSFLDVALGTFYMPANSMPHTTGISGHERTAYPRTFLKQLLYPLANDPLFRSRRFPSKSPGSGPSRPPKSMLRIER